MNLFKVLKEDYIKQCLENRRIGGYLFNKYIDDDKQWKDSISYENFIEKYYEGAFTLENAFPLDLFGDTEEMTFNEMIAQIFSSAVMRDNRFPVLKPSYLPQNG